MNRPFKILCIDGGGIKGLFSAQVLAEFEEAFKTNTSDHFDLVCGTSTGGIIALGVAAEIPMSQVVDFYKNKGPEIFCQKYKIGSVGELLFSLKQAIVKSKYSEKHLRKALEDVFKDRKIKSSQNLLCIPAFNITTSTPRIFKKDYEHLNQDSDKTFVEVALATAAAPTYFPIQEIDSVQYIDGGLFANNPIMVGLTEAVFKGYWIKPKNERKKDDFDGVEILSISSCEIPSGDVAKRNARSFMNWKSTLFDAYSVGQSKSNEIFINQIRPYLDFEVNIKRVKNGLISPKQAEVISLDKASKASLQVLQGIGAAVGNNEKNDPMVKKFYTEEKTINL